MSVIIAIDPDVEKSGVAFFDKETKKLELSNLSFPNLIDYFIFVASKRKDEKVCVVVEASWLSKTNWHLKSRDNKRMSSAKGYDVGRNHETGVKIVEMARHFGFEVIEQRPLKKFWKGHDGKITHEELDDVLSNACVPMMVTRTNQEMRDAALLAIDAANIPIRISVRKKPRTYIL